KNLFSALFGYKMKGELMTFTAEGFDEAKAYRHAKLLMMEWEETISGKSSNINLSKTTTKVARLENNIWRVTLNVIYSSPSAPSYVLTKETETERLPLVV